MMRVVGGTATQTHGLLDTAAREGPAGPRPHAGGNLETTFGLILQVALKRNHNTDYTGERSHLPIPSPLHRSPARAQQGPAPRSLKVLAAAANPNPLFGVANEADRSESGCQLGRGVGAGGTDGAGGEAGCRRRVRGRQEEMRKFTF